MKLCTDFEFRKRGVATCILDYVAQEFKVPINLHVDKNARHDDLVNFYKRRAFQVDTESEADTLMVRI